MKLFTMFFRDEQQTSVEIFECWEVRWNSRNGEYSGNTAPEVMVFPKHKDAVSFKRALEDAFRLIKHTSGTVVTLKKRSQP